MTKRRSETGFQQALLELAKLPADADNASLAAASARLREAFLGMGSETPDNLDCLRHVEIGRITDGTSLARPCWGLRLANCGAALSEVINAAEGMEIPAMVLEQYPRVSQDEWDAALRFVTMTLSAFEGAPAEDA